MTISAQDTCAKSLATLTTELAEKAFVGEFDGAAMKIGRIVNEERSNESSIL